MKSKIQNINYVEIGIVLLHLIVSLFFWISYKTGFIPIDQLKNWINTYYNIFSLIFIIGFFRLLRKWKYYLLWILIGIVQLIFYFNLKDNSDFLLEISGTAFSGLRSLLPVLILFQLFRQYLKKKYNLEFIIALGSVRMSLYEEEEHRNVLWIEVAYSLILMAAIFIFGII